MDGLVVVATVYKNAKFVGYRFVNINSQDVKDVSYESFKKVMSQNLFHFLNCKLHSDNSIHGIGMSLSDLSKIDIGYSVSDKRYCTNNKPMVLLERTRVNTLVALDFAGKFEVINQDILPYFQNRFVNTVPIINNFKSSNSSSNRLSSNSGKAAPTSGTNNSINKNKNSSSVGKQSEVDLRDIKDNLGCAISEDSTDDKKYKAFDLLEESTINTKDGDVYLTTVGIPIVDFEADDSLYDYKKNSSMTAGSKLAIVILALRDVNYFYFSILQGMNRILVSPDNPFVKTACVSKDNLYINVGFIDSLDTSEILFLLMHEMMHIFYRHLYYGLKKNNNIHNIATDLIINRKIAEDYGAFPNAGKQDISEYGSYAKACGIKFIEGGLWNDHIDLSVDTSETIYREIMDSKEEVSL